MLEISLEIWPLWALFLVSLPLSGWKHWNFQPFQPFQHVSGCVSRISGSCNFFMTIYFFEFNHHLLVAKRRESQHQETATTECCLGRFQREFPEFPEIHESFERKCSISTGNSSGKSRVPYWKSGGGNQPLSSWKCT